MEQIVDAVARGIIRSGLVQLEVSARHVHLSAEDLEVLFGKGANLTPKRELSQPGQYLSEERVNVIGSKGRKDGIAVLGPVRSSTQIELSKSDCVALGVKAPVRQSGDTVGSGYMVIEGPKGSVTLKEGVIIASSHIHTPPEVAQELGLTDDQKVMVEVMSDRPVIFKDVIIRISSQFRYRMHVDVDEANAANVQGFTLGRIIK